MVPESGNFLIRLQAVMLAAVFAVGCSSLTTVKHRLTGPADAGGSGHARQGVTETGSGVARQPASAVSTRSAQQDHQRLIASSDAAPLPRQEYDAKGSKIPYVPQPNPYTTDARPVPTEARAMFITANARLQAGELKSAQAKFEQLTKKYPKLSGSWVRLGAIAERRNNSDAAIKDYRKAIAVNRNNVNAYIALGLAQRRKGSFGDAQQTYLAALKVWKDFPEAHLDLAILYDLYGNDAEAAQKHYEAYDFLTGHRDDRAHKWLAEVKQRTGIEDSFIDTPPVMVELVAPDKADDNSVAAAPDRPDRRAAKHDAE